MNGSKLMGLDSVGVEIYDIHEYFQELTVGQRTLGFWGVTFFHSFFVHYRVLRLIALNLRYFFHPFFCFPL